MNPSQKARCEMCCQLKAKVLSNGLVYLDQLHFLEVSLSTLTATIQLLFFQKELFSIVSALMDLKSICL